MSKTKFFAIDPQGVEHLRTSKNRIYTHTVIVLRGAAHLEAQRPKLADIVARNNKSWDRIENEAKGIFPNAEQWRGPKALASWQAFAIEWMTKHTREGALAEAIAHDDKVFKARVASGRDLVYENAGWCGRLDLARKLADQMRKNSFEAVVILEAQVKQPKR